MQNDGLGAFAHSTQVDGRRTLSARPPGIRPVRATRTCTGDACGGNRLVCGRDLDPRAALSEDRHRRHAPSASAHQERDLQQDPGTWHPALRPRAPKQDADRRQRVCAGLGITSATLTSWIKSRGLRASSRQNGWKILRSALRRWIAAHPNLISLAKVDKVWFLALAFQPPQRGRAR